MMNKIISTIVIGAALAGCHADERAQLHSQVDSLRNALVESKKVETTLSDVGVLLDSIDAGRQMLNTNIVEGTRYSNYSQRLNSINGYIRDSRAKIDQLEKSMKSSNAGYVATIRRLRTELDSRSEQLTVLQQEVEKVRTENTTLNQTVVQRDSAIAGNNETIRMRESNITELETRMEESRVAAQATQADLYFAEAKALETAADRTKFAAKKKKETRKQALELYKISLSLGKTEAQSKVDELEKSI